ncbi:MFS transporter [Halomonas sp. MCCC 1A11036]|uniref:MFS transporter n=1 Tax=Billgrantia zhangzhouensis TaxID=2733481 RepID=A0ABS9AGM7_9GAMM|nr:MFS transporter [Halomonas zhangzhouensis]MCE8020910.1 MFS transporter [Halomonas zhangzhouensis]
MPIPPSTAMPVTSRAEGWWVLAATTWIQVLCSGGMLLVPTLAPQIAAAFGVATNLVGLQVSLLYGVAMLASLQSAVVARRLGGCRSSQLAMVLVMVGCLLALLGSPLALLAMTFLLGLAYGMTSPAAAELLTRFTPAERRNLVYSIKQTGVPLGGVLAGLLAPPLAALWNWQAAFLAVGAACLVTLLLLQLRRALWDATRDASVRMQGGGSLTVLYRSRAMRWLGATGFCLSAAQLSLLSFAVAYMVEELLLSLVAAGAVVSMVHVAGVAGRLAWGALADRLRAGLPVLFGLTGAIALVFLLLSVLSGALPTWLIIALMVIAGATAVGWNGVYLAEVARRCEPGEVGEATAAVLVLTYMGVLVGPALFSLIVWLSDSYAIGFLLPTATGALAVICLLRCVRSSRVVDGDA